MDNINKEAEKSIISGRFLIALPIILFIYFFTRQESEGV